MGDSKIVVLFVNGRKRDRNNFIDIIKQKFLIEDRTNKDLSSCSARQIIRKIQGCENQFQQFLPNILLFENINQNIVKIVGDELENMIFDISLSKFSQNEKNCQINSYLMILDKICNNWL